MKKAPKLAQIGVLCFFLGTDTNEIIKHTKTVYEWEGILYEVTGSKSKTAPASHYVTIPYGGIEWKIRELGNKSELYKQIKNERNKRKA